MRLMDTDSWGNPVCGQDFMAGTICTDVPGHSGGHRAFCQKCGNDWYDQTCTCHPRCPQCEAYVGEPGSQFCENCACSASICLRCDNPSTCTHALEYCQYVDNHYGEHNFRLHDDPPTDEELAEVYKSLGVIPMQ